MKSIIKTSLISILFAFVLYGCEQTKIQIIDNNKVVTNNVPMKAFNDETYIWENWTFSTNEVKNIEQ